PGRQNRRGKSQPVEAVLPLHHQGSRQIDLLTKMAQNYTLFFTLSYSLDCKPFNDLCPAEPSTTVDEVAAGISRGATRKNGSECQCVLLHNRPESNLRNFH